MFLNQDILAAKAQILKVFGNTACGRRVGEGRLAGLLFVSEQKATDLEDRVG